MSTCAYGTHVLQPNNISVAIVPLYNCCGTHSARMPSNVSTRSTAVLACAREIARPTTQRAMVRSCYSSNQASERARTRLYSSCATLNEEIASLDARRVSARGAYREGGRWCESSEVWAGNGRE